MENYFTEVLWVNIFMYIGYFTRMDGLYGSKGITWKKKKINDPEQLATPSKDYKFAHYIGQHFLLDVNNILKIPITRKILYTMCNVIAY